MNITAIQPRLALLTGAFTLVPLCLCLAADTSAPTSEVTTTQAAPSPAPVVTAEPAPVKLPYGVEDVLKLTRAQIGEEIILNYVQGSGTIYNLTPKDIVYLRDQGVSQKVLNAMLDQRRRAVEMAAQNAAPVTTVQNAPTVANAPMVPDANAAPVASAYTDPNAAYATAPLTPPASSVYVVPYAPSYPYYGSYGSYGYSYPYYYGGWYGPSVSFAFGFGGHGHFYGGHGFHGGGHGSFAHGGGHR
jgi:hypothetical protein